MSETQRDRIYAAPRDDVGAFEFDAGVAAVFPDMIKRSVPGYSFIVSAIGLLAERYARPETVCYDLGCSLGAATLAMRQRLEGRDCRIVAVDSSKPMVTRCRENIAAYRSTVPVEVVCADVLDAPIKNASVVVMNFTLQFIQPSARIDLLGKIYQALTPGGVLILSEKVAFEDEREQRLQDEMHLAFKRANGYSELEISQKRTALENVLQMDTLACHRSRLTDAGFTDCDVWFQAFNFAAMIAYK